MSKTISMEAVKAKKRAASKTGGSDMIQMIDHAGTLDAEIKQKTKQLDALKTEIRASYTPGMAEMHGEAYKVVFTERENWKIHPRDFFAWLKKHYTGKRFNELAHACVKISNEAVRSSLGDVVVEAIGQQSESSIAVGFRKREG